MTDEQGTKILLREPVIASNLVEMLQNIGSESERGQALICHAVLDDILSRLIGSFFVESYNAKILLSDGNAPLNTSWARIEIALALGLIGDGEYRDLNTIRKIRNKFAHEWNASFNDDDVRDRCKNLQSGFVADDGPLKFDYPADQFKMASIALVCSLCNRPVYAANERRQPKEWPR